MTTPRMPKSLLLLLCLATAACVESAEAPKGLGGAVSPVLKTGAKPVPKGALPNVGAGQIPKDGLNKVFDIEENKPADANAAVKNLDKAFDIEENKPADANAAAKNLDKAFDIEELKAKNAAAGVENLDKAFDMEENKPAQFHPAETIDKPTLSTGKVPPKTTTKTGAPQLPTASPGAKPGG